MDMAKTTVGKRSSDGAVQILNIQQKTDEFCMVGGQIKYLNACIECSPRGAEPTNLLDNSGWLEWGVIWQVEELDDLAITNIGTEQLGVLLNRMYRNNCLMTGCIPIGARQSMITDIKLKVPDRMQKLTIGSIFKIFCYFRSSSSTDVRTDSHRLLVSTQYKTYN